MWTMDVYARGALPPAVAIFLIAGSLIAVVAGVAAGFLRARRRDVLAATAEASVGDRPPPLVEGSDVVLSGVVQHFKDHEVAVKIRVTQTGFEQESSGSWSHSWIEIDREIILAPFLLELPGGELVLVEPPKNVDVADALDQKVWIDRNRRVLSAELVPGERIYARGRLERSDQAAATSAYREVQWGWALRSSGGQMLLSSEPLGRGLRDRAAFHRHFAWTAIGVLLATQLTLLGFYGRLGGRTKEETITGTNAYVTTDSDGDSHHHYEVEVRGDTIAIAPSDYEEVHQGMTIPIRFGSEGNWALGEYATILWWHGLLVSGAAIALWLWYAARRRSSRPWFRRKVNDSGRGRLPDPP
jgi:hypothetical protein